jgi:carbamoyltransferase
VLFVLKRRPNIFFLRDRIRNLKKVKGIKDILAEEFGVNKDEIKAELFNVEHHLAHLASSFLVSPFETSTIVSVDAFGDFSSCKVAKGRGNKIHALYEVNYPHSLGIFYTAFTQFLGFPNFGDEYKVMGLAARGKPTYLEKMEKVLILKPRGRFELNLDYFSFFKQKQDMKWDNVRPTVATLYSPKMIEAFGPAREKGEELTERHCDLAFSMQAMYEKAFFHVLNYAYEKTKNPNLCLAGGCALNSLANGKIFDNTPFKEIYIQPASSDAGGCLGAAYYVFHQILGKPRTFEMKHAFWGPGFGQEEIRKVIEQNKDKVVVEEIKEEEELIKRTARFISEGKVVGWFQGRLEWGPRALGNRSILADPRKPEMREILNQRIKKREWFRPFAPSILEEYVGEYFEKSYPDPFMIKVYPIRQEKRRLIPAVTHVDGTGRLQTVGKEENPLYWKLINEFKELTGIPLVLNTSFNENEPIVCTPEEAMDCFLRTKMDVLAMSNFIVQRR